MTEQQPVDQLLRKLEDPTLFDDDERQILRKMIKVYRGIEAWGWLARWIAAVLVGTAAAMGAWDFIVTRLKTWAGP